MGGRKCWLKNCVNNLGGKVRRTNCGKIRWKSWLEKLCRKIGCTKLDRKLGITNCVEKLGGPIRRIILLKSCV